MKNTAQTIDEYISQFPPKVQAVLFKIRQIIADAAPAAQEKINYGIPTFIYHGNLVHFGGYKQHIGFYPGPGAIQAFKSELTGYETSKGTIKFSLNQKIPYALIKKITKYRVEKNSNH